MGESRYGVRKQLTRGGGCLDPQQDGSIKYIRQDDDGGLARQATVLQLWNRQACLAARGERLELRALGFFSLTSSDFDLTDILLQKAGCVRDLMNLSISIFAFHFWPHRRKMLFSKLVLPIILW